MTKIIKWILASTFTLASVAIVAAYWFTQQLSAFPQQQLSLDAPIEIEITRGNTAIGLVHRLQNDGLITDAWKMKYLLKLEPHWAQIKTGLFALQPGDNLADVLNRIKSGEQMVFSVTLIEGKTIKEWQALLNEQSRLTVDEDVFNKVLAKHGDTSGLPEGKFYPDTYQFHAGDSAQSVLERSYLRMQTEIDNAWQQRDPQLKLKTPYELLIMASIIEKETAQSTERDWVSAVFNNRLKKGMRLQTDPTVIYGMGDRFNGNITRKDLREHTPFNTYRINGLPPTPIAAPSRASLIAAAKPADVDYLYFVSRNDGTHVFSTNLRDHNNAVNKFQRNQ
ncbi:endolytic transglycosylase MltG [Shewanella maritima]|uniref:Endolytic murein transglycosylase n=1 Tax=Shewanella maritima TaxID=2520507 RepID=A0A411PM10_9GAMM|nr:endolytic transglycosylase MltG [Shewanella maritima]QBF84563.1 endolytic transglycosylase MltG [Shewanella maritima]